MLRRLGDPTMRTSAEAGRDVIELGLSRASPGERGFFTLLEKDESSPESMDKGKQEALWTKSAAWARITEENSALV